MGCNSRIDKFEVGWVLAQHDTVRKNVYLAPKQTTTILSRHTRLLLGQGPTYAILFAYMKVAPTPI